MVPYKTLWTHRKSTQLVPTYSVNRTIQILQPEGFKKKGGTFKGDDKKGAYKISGDVFLAGKYTLEGSYSVSGNDVTIKNSLTAKNPKLITCKHAEKKMRSYF